MHEYLESLRNKPVDVRERIAFGSALGASGLIAFIWLGLLISGDSLSVRGTIAEEKKSDSLMDAFREAGGNIAGALGASFDSGPAKLETVEERRGAAPVVEEQTVIPF